MDTYPNNLYPSANLRTTQFKSSRIIRQRMELVAGDTYFDPQKNCIEPFPQIGNNTVAQTLDMHQVMCELWVS